MPTSYSVELPLTVTVRLATPWWRAQARSMKTIVLIVAAVSLSNVSLAQVGTTIKEGAKATGEKTAQYGDQAKVAMSSQPSKTNNKAKAQVHKAKARDHAQVSKEAAKEIPK